MDSEPPAAKDLDFEKLVWYDRVVVWILLNPGQFFAYLALVVAPLMVISAFASYKMVQGMDARDVREQRSKRELRQRSRAGTSSRNRK